MTDILATPLTVDLVLSFRPCWGSAQLDTFAEAYPNLTVGGALDCADITLADRVWLGCHLLAHYSGQSAVAAAAKQFAARASAANATSAAAAASAAAYYADAATYAYYAATHAASAAYAAAATAAYDEERRAQLEILRAALAAATCAPASPVKCLRQNGEKP